MAEGLVPEMLILEKSTGSCKPPVLPPEIHSARNRCQNSLTPLATAITCRMAAVVLARVNNRIG